MRPSLILLALVFSNTLWSQSSFSTPPYGYVKLNVSAGNGSSRKVTLFSAPLLGTAQISGASTGKISFIGSNTLSSQGADWQVGELSNPVFPHAIMITSGQEQGRIFLISTSTANTSDTVYIDDSEITRHGSLRGLFLSINDSFKIIPIDTISSLFGTPESSLVQGGANPNSADIVSLVSTGTAISYYFNTNLGRWSRVSLGSPDASNVPLHPYYGIQYARLAATPLEFIVMGEVAMGGRVVPIKNSGTTILSQYWASDRLLSSLGIQYMDGWKTGVNAGSSDTLVATFGGSANSFFNDGTNWRRVALGNPLANSFALPIGSSVLINKKGNLQGFTPHFDYAPY